MGDRKKEVCRRGHKLEEPNLLYNQDFRECKTCAYKRASQSRKERRAALKWLGFIVKVGERRIKDDTPRIRFLSSRITP
jgi:hypothetical protein